jgi:hypothetical protein
MNNNPTPTATSAVATRREELCTFLIELPSGVDVVVDAATFEHLRSATAPTSCILSPLQTRMILARTIDFGRRVVHLDSHSEALELAEALLAAGDDATVTDVLLANELRDLLHDLVGDLADARS